MVKFKSRYLLVELLFENDKNNIKLDATRLSNVVRLNVQKYFGDIGLGKILRNFQVKYVNNMTNIAIMRVARDHTNILWSTLVMISDIDSEQIKLRIVGNSGSIKKCEKKASDLLQNWVEQYEKNNSMKLDSI